MLYRILYTYAENADKQPVIHVNIGKGSVNMILDSEADLNEVTSEVANA